MGIGWEQRAYSFLLAYSRIVDVDLWFRPTPDNPDLSRITPLLPLCRSMTAFYPGAIDDPSSGLRSRLARYLSSADVVHVLRFQEFVWNLEHPCLVWDIDEIPWPLRPPERNAGTQRRMPDEQRARLSAAHARSVSRARLVIGCSALERPPDCASFAVIPNVVRRPHPVGADATVDAAALLFVGNLSYIPNTDGLAFFADEVLPILEGLVPDVRIRVVGRSPGTDRTRAAVDRLRRVSRFDFAFDVPDCTPHYGRCAVSIAPIRMGGGTRVKIIEAFAHRHAVVSTTKGCEGLGVQAGGQLLIADSPRDFALACAELLTNPPLRTRVADAGFDFFERHHTQEIVDRQLASELGRLLSTGARTAGPAYR